MVDTISLGALTNEQTAATANTITTGASPVTADPSNPLYTITTGATAGTEYIELDAFAIEVGFNSAPSFIGKTVTFVMGVNAVDEVRIRLGPSSPAFVLLGTTGHGYATEVILTASTPGVTAQFVWTGAGWSANYSGVLVAGVTYTPANESAPRNISADGGVSGSPGGAASLQGGDSDSGTGGLATLRGGASTDGTGGAALVRGADSTNSNAGHATVQGGDGGAGAGGNAVAKGGYSDSAQAGRVLLTGGETSTGTAGDVTLTGGESYGAADGGHVILAGGASASGDVGSVKVQGLPTSDPLVAGALYTLGALGAGVPRALWVSGGPA